MKNVLEVVVLGGTMCYMMSVSERKWIECDFNWQGI